MDLAGGTLDFWPLYSFIGDCRTINLSIDVQTHVTLTPREDRQVILDVQDLNYKKSFSELTEVLNAKDQELALVKSVLDYFQPTFGFELSTRSESPVGGGLGGSSSLCISLIKAFCQWMKKDLDLYTMVRLASNLEAHVLHTPTGTQDYYPAARAGLGVIHYRPDGPQHELLPFPSQDFNHSFFLVYTGRPHHSGINNWQVYKAVVEKDSKTIAALKGVRDITNVMYSALKSQNWEVLPELFTQEYEMRVQLAPSFSSPEIDQIQKWMTSSGAKAVKICGAGGGGCVLVWCQPENKSKLVEICQSKKFEVLLPQVVRDPSFYGE